jgi:hypothetical protein
VHLLRSGAQQRPGALVDGGARRVDVVDERQRARPRTRGERAAHVAPASERIQTALGPHIPRAADELHDRQVPPARQLAGQLRGRIGPALQAAIAHGGDGRERLDARALQLMGDERPGQPHR